jgi:3',5'-cyclic-AMP phosphodiesterase
MWVARPVAYNRAPVTLPMREEPFLTEPMTFLHLSDLHVAPPGRLVHGIDPVPQVQRVIERIRALDVVPAFVVVSGDLTDDGSDESYQVLKPLLGEIGNRNGHVPVPVLLALGNHDDRAMFRRVVLGLADADGCPYFHSQQIDGLRVVVLDSVIPGETAGELGAEQLAWLEEELRLPAPGGTLIVLHHPCRLAGPAHHYPDFILRDSAALEAIVAGHRGQIAGILAGHSHQANAASVAGTLHATAPAVLVQLDFFAGEGYVPVPGAGFNLCHLDGAGLVVSPALLDRDP